MSNQNFSMTAPQNEGGFSKREKRADVSLVPFGTQPAICYAIIDLGTQENEYPAGSKNINQSHKIKFMFEFPLHKQLFYVDDTDFKPSVLSLEFAFAMYKNKQHKPTKLLEFVESLFGPLDPSQYGTFDFSKLLGQYVLCNIVHKAKAAGGVYANISSIAPFQIQFYQDQYNSGMLNPTNPWTLYSLGMGFNTAAFASVDYWNRKLIKSSLEGIAYTNTGGRFVKYDETGALALDDSTSPVQSMKDLNGGGQQGGQTAQQMYNQGVQQNYGQPAPQQQNPQSPAQGYGQPAPQQQPIQQFQQAPATQAGPNYQNNQQPIQGQPVQQQVYQQAPTQQFQQQPANTAQPPMGQPVQNFAPQQPMGNVQQPIQQTAQQPVGGFTQPQQPVAPTAMPGTAVNPVQQFQQTPPPSNAGAVSPAQQFQQGGQPAANTGTMGTGVQQPMGGMQSIPNQPQATGTAPAHSYGQPQQAAPQQASMFEQPGGFKEEEHDDLPF